MRIDIPGLEVLRARTSTGSGPSSHPVEVGHGHEGLALERELSLAQPQPRAGQPAALLEVAVVVGRSEALDGERGVDDDVRGRRSDALLELSIEFAFALVVLGLREILRSEVNIELNFPPKLRGARSRLYKLRRASPSTRR